MLAGDAQPVETYQNFDQQTRSKMIGFLRTCVSRARRVREQILALERQLDDLVIEAEALEEGALALLLLTRSAQGRAGAGQESDDPGAPALQPVAHSLILTRRPDKFFEVRIDFAKEPFAIQQQLGLFLAFIAAGRPGGPGGLVDYRTEKELFDYLKDIGSRTKNPHRYIGNLVNALKDLLNEAGFSRDYVQRNSHGVRFRLRTPGSPVSERRVPAGVLRA